MLLSLTFLHCLIMGFGQLETCGNIALQVQTNAFTAHLPGMGPESQNDEAEYYSEEHDERDSHEGDSIDGQSVNNLGLAERDKVASVFQQMPPLWPHPKVFQFHSGVRYVIPSFTFFRCDNLPRMIREAFQRYMDLTFPHGMHAKSAVDGIVSLQVSMDSTDESFPQLGVDESYTLTVPQKGPATLHAKTPFGVLHGLETFSQLVNFDFQQESYVVSRTPWSIEDAPRFPHRGLMIDTARHFLPIRTIKETIDTLPFAKLNVLHWHMSDSESFPLQSKRREKLWQGAMSQRERYLQAEVEEVVEYARLRGVRVMIELDMPGHAASWCNGYPEVCPSTSCRQPLNVASNATFELIADLLAEITGEHASKPGSPSAGLFKDNFIHLGGDEVDMSCWEMVPSVRQWLESHHMTLQQGYKHFVQRVADIAISHGHRPVQWSEVYDSFGTSLHNQTVIHFWRSKKSVAQAVEDGYDVLMSRCCGSGTWYLDHIDEHWESLYLADPCQDVPDVFCHKVLGGHGEMWGETVDTSDLDQTVWPRMAVIAERLWSPRNITSIDPAGRRLHRFRCLLNSRGVKAAPVETSQARSSPFHAGSCFSQ